jgi:predicted peptidase
MKQSWSTLAATVLVAAGVCQHEPVRTQGAKPDTAGYVARTYTSGSQKMPYRLFVPKGYDRTKRYPLVVWLHGAGGAGTDNIKQIVADQIPGTRLWINAENQAAHPAFVVAPQSDRAWTSGMDSPELRPDARLVAGMLDALATEFPIDRTRVYLLGQSAGAGGAWSLATNQPERFAGVLLVCPSLGNVTRSWRAAHVPLWVFQGERDTLIVKTRELVELVAQNGGHPRFTVYPDEGHDIWTRAFAEPDLVEWLFAQKR